MFTTHFFFFFNDTATTEIYTLSLHDALPISRGLPARVVGERRSAGRQPRHLAQGARDRRARDDLVHDDPARDLVRSEEHTSELQSPCNLACRLLLEKKKLDSVKLRQLFKHPG